MHGLKFLVVLSLMCLCISCGTATLAINESPKEEMQDIEGQFLRHKRSIYDCFKRYMDYSDFLDQKSYITTESVDRFKDLFMDNAIVWNDYLWKAKYEYASAYADQAYYYHRVKGLKVEFEDRVLDKLYAQTRMELLRGVDDSDAENVVYKYGFKARKGIYYILNKEKKVIYFDEPIYYDLEFIFHIDSDEKDAKIMDIKLVEDKKFNKKL